MRSGQLLELIDSYKRSPCDVGCPEDTEYGGPRARWKRLMIDGISSEDWLCNLDDDSGSHVHCRAYSVMLPFQSDRKSAQRICECPAWPVLSAPSCSE